MYVSTHMTFPAPWAMVDHCEQCEQFTPLINGDGQAGFQDSCRGGLYMSHAHTFNSCNIHSQPSFQKCEFWNLIPS